ncbi:hypothetical protein BDV29DRAFT_193004 [Aspergillus leporis]|uniref:Uncharacterized protein n=1 Tax=Aspergillus leporis TaxID=41062 RepID=A0A5N5WT78_9EURO|nr:hypothetical protein BDV29DRAFT_193004 [Aspergillus leporis]
MESRGASACFRVACLGYDGAIHLTEEMRDLEVAAMLGSIALNAVLGFDFLLAVRFCMGDIQAALNSNTGYPIIEIFRNMTGSTVRSTVMTSMLILTAGLATIPTIVLALLGLVNIGSTTAFNAVLSFVAFALHVSYIVPIGFSLWRRIAAPETLTYGPWRLDCFGAVVNIISLGYLMFTTVFRTVLIFSALYWTIKGRKVYEGPKI